MVRVKFIDRPCGFGKTRNMLEGLKPEELYLIVVPSLTEVERVISARPDLGFVAPSDDLGTKSGHLKELIKQKENVVCTHSLYHLNVNFYKEGWLSCYNIIIDEVLSVVDTIPGPKPKSWEEFYIGKGYVEVEADGRILPTEKWRELHGAVDDTLHRDLFEKAETGCLFRHSDRFFLWSVSPYLVTSGKSCTVMSFKVEGSIMALYLDKLGIDYDIERGTGEEDKLRRSFAELANLVPLPFGVKLSHTAQTSTSNGKAISKVAPALRTFKVRAGREIFKRSDGVIVTCAKGNWFSRPSDECPRPDGVFAKGSRLAETAIWLPNTTRGTNLFKHCDVGIYLWDQYMNPAVKQWLGCTSHQEEQYALSELLQWLYRTCIRDGKPATFIIPSPRMNALLKRWVDGEL